MSNTFRHWFLFPAACAMAGLLALALTVQPGLAQSQTTGGPRNEVRMDVDFTVLPKVLPDGNEAPASSAAPPEEPLTPEQALPDAADAAAPSEKPAANNRVPTAETRPTPKPAPAEQAEIPAVTPVKEPGVIRSVSLDESARGFTLKVVADRPVGQIAFMNLNNPRRLVVDFLGKWSHRDGNVLRSEGVVKHVVMGEHPDRFRMVVHFRTPPKKTLTPDIRKAGDEVHVLVALP
ncbi:AMIN domain-containing protein [Pseudodesulfovibrio methanolicus]|uniref:AMIN domain-containing protein n=1 Tax=Pseudodesulfovibrio methanolicus TaxID=3126690 RepID=A0ABZ2IXE6_9BACT